MTQERDPNGGEMDFRMPERQSVEPGEVIKGVVVHVSESHVFLDIGGKSEASLEVREVTDSDGNVTVKPGDSLEAYVLEVDPEVTLSYGMARSKINLRVLEDAYDLGVPVEGKVSGVNKGGLEIDLGGVRGFCPISQVEMGYCEDPSRYLEQTLKFRVLELKEGGRNVVVSRRALLEEERKEAAEALRDQLQPGAEFEGEVVTLQPYGAFVDLGGIQGLVHVSEITHSRIDHPADVLKVGERVRVQVLKIQPDPKNPERQRIGLSIKALARSPWDAISDKLQEGATVSGTVVRLQPFGAFVELAPGVDGLVHISELADRRINHPADVVSVGQQVDVTVLKVDRGSKRISLSMRGGATASADDLVVGAVVDVVVDRIKPFGLLVSIKGFGRNARGLVPSEETSAGRNANLRKIYPEGSEHKAMVVQIDPGTGKIRLSFKAVQKAEEQGEYREFVGSGPKDRGGEGRGPASGGSQSLGTLGDLLQDALKKD